MLAAMRVKSPFSQSVLFGFTALPLSDPQAGEPRLRPQPLPEHRPAPSRSTLALPSTARHAQPPPPHHRPHPQSAPQRRQRPPPTPARRGAPGGRPKAPEEARSLTRRPAATSSSAGRRRGARPRPRRARARRSARRCSGAPAPAMQVISSLPSPSVAITCASVASGSPHATSDSSTKPIASPTLKRPSASSRAAGATEPLRTRASACAIAAAFSLAERDGGCATSAASAVCWLREGTTTTCFSDSSAARSGGHDHVRAVGQHDDLLGRHGVDRRRAARRSTGSSSGRRRARARRGCGRARRCRRSRRPRARRSARLSARWRVARADLGVHVGDVDVRDLAGAGDGRDRLLGLVGVNVDLQRAGVADDEQRVAERVERGARSAPSRGATPVSAKFVQ